MRPSLLPFNEPNTMDAIYRTLGSQSPVIVLSILGIIVCVVMWRRAPLGSMWAFFGLLLSLLLSLGGPFVQPTLTFFLSDVLGFHDTLKTSTLIMAFFSLIRGLSYALLLVGVYAGRRTATFQM